MSYYKSSKQLSQSKVSDINRFGSDDTFVVDLESKVDSLKNSKVFNSASLSLNTTLLNMSKIARGYNDNIIIIELIYIRIQISKFQNGSKLIQIDSRCIYRKVLWFTTFHSYEKYELRERMKRPFYKENDRVEQISHYANKLARNLNFNTTEWDSILLKSKERHLEFKPIDIALLLNSLSRGRIYDKELFELLIPQIIKKISFFTSVHLSMVLSAYSKGKMLTPDLYNILKFEISSRIYEFRTSIEMCMVLNAISKFGDNDKIFLSKISNHILKSFRYFNFSPQELSVIINSLVTLGYYHEQLFNIFSSQLMINNGNIGNLVNNLNACNIFELLRVLNGFMIFENNYKDIQNQCKHEIVSRVRFSAPNDLTNSLYALGTIKSTLNNSNISVNQEIIEEIVMSIKNRSLNTLQNFKMECVSNLLVSFSKWSFELGQQELLNIIEHMFTIRMELNIVDLSNTLVAITKLFCASSCINDFNDIKSVGENNQILLVIQKLMRKWSNEIIALLEQEKNELNTIIKIIDCYNKFGVYEDKLYSKIKSIIALNHLGELNKNNAYSLYEIFNKHRGMCRINSNKFSEYTKYDDFMEILTQSIS
ncbi:uncharacterized protein TA06160 [Theileria annulata]|uniref:Uncharacterized protein n=1 Tax=Theileria annulata TaxID=5874 RepID=Q4UI68_THEAN|nr:uncharacterized protein TA06160 [Theileria annulata]CAI73221.1 hypothetical protein, conserved [Theileria annulata]|eukprot:XP_953898.1 hypothetical protein, conserved [Theileria annulata]